jgi:uncharacterized repeat protein (TIGR01451 family)
MQRHHLLLFPLLAACASLDGTPPARKVEKGVVWVAQALPTGRSSTSAVLVERGTPEKVPVGRPYEYEIRVTNLTKHELYDVVLEEYLGESVTLNHAEPAPTSAEPRLARWNFGTLAAEQKLSVRVNVTPAATGDLANRCQVVYRALVGGTVTVVEPKLAIESVVPAQSLVDEPIGVRLTVRNPGTGDASNVVITGDLPEGLKTLDGQTAVKIDVGALPAGAAKEFVVHVKGSATGAYAVKAVARSGEGLAAETAATALEVRRPRLEVEAQMPGDWLLDRPLSTTVKVRNAGDGEARRAALEVELPEGVRYVGASEGVASLPGRIRWELGTLAVGQERSLELKVSATRAGDLAFAAKATADFTEAVATTMRTRLVGVPALALEVTDNEDPIAMGGEVTYTITVRNQGTAADKNVRIECALDGGMALVNADGATKREGSGDEKPAFVSLDDLAPGQSATWWVKVKVGKTGDLRFRVSMTSGQLERPVEETEATAAR